MLFNRVEEAQAAQYRKDFLSKLSIANEEARETLYWLRLLEINSIINILTKIIKTLTENKSG